MVLGTPLPSVSLDLLPTQGSHRSLLTSTRLGAEIGVKLMKGIEYGGKDTGVKFGFDIRFTGHKIRLKEHLVYEDGDIDVSKSDLTIDGIEMMNVGFAAGSEDGLKDNLKARLEFSPNEQFQVPGYPFVVTIGCKFFLDLVASSKDSTVWGKGAYEIKGPLGIGGGTAQTPTITVRTPISDNLGGVTIGPMGFVIGFEPKVMLGMGIANVVNGGVYGKVRFSLGIARGSILGAPLVDCYGITWKIEEGLGVGMNYIVNLASILGLKGKNNKGDTEISETMVPVWNPPTSGPSSKMCVGG